MLSVRPNQALCAVSTPTSPAKLWLVRFKPESASTDSNDGSGEVESITALDEFSPVPPLEIRTALGALGHSVVVCAVDEPQGNCLLSSLCFPFPKCKHGAEFWVRMSINVYSITKPMTDPSQFFEITCIYSKDKKDKGQDVTPLPVILVPHGGPHSAFGCQFLSAYSFFALMGYCVVLVNYRGSTGFGQAALESLHGKVGR